MHQLLETGTLEPSEGETMIDTKSEKVTISGKPDVLLNEASLVLYGICKALEEETEMSFDEAYEVINDLFQVRTLMGKGMTEDEAREIILKARD